MALKYKLLRGFKDYLPKDTEMAQWIEGHIHELATLYNFKEVRFPVLEETTMFYKSSGESSDIVTKQMYSFKDKGDRDVTLRPEGTPSCMRLALEHNLPNELGLPLKLFYIEPMFRYERPQKGRLRQHTQYGFEVIGAAGPTVDAELIDVLVNLYQRLKFKNLEIEINSVGCPNCRPAYVSRLRLFLENKSEDICTDCNLRKNVNPLRALDCKKETCATIYEDAPQMLASLCSECAIHFSGLQSILTSWGHTFILNSKLVRGLDYYSRTAFEITCPTLGAQKTIAGGGRYDGLSLIMGGPKLPSIGFGAGLERLMLAIELQNTPVPKEMLDVVIVLPEANALNEGQKLLYSFRKNSISCEMNYEPRTLKKLMKWANQQGARFTAILGEDEYKNGKITLKDMLSGDQQVHKLEDVTAWLADNCK